MFREMRRRNQALDREACVEILHTEKRGVLSVHGEDGYPYAIPLNFVFDEAEETIYFHCAKEGHKLDAIRQNEKVCFTTWTAGDPDAEDGWSYHVSSVVVFGCAEVVTDETVKYEKAKALGLKYFPTREMVDEELEHALVRAELVGICIDHMTGKRVHEK